MLQVLSQEWKDDTVRVHELSSVQTGWNTPDILKGFKEIFGPAAVKVTIAEGSAPNPHLGLRDSWFLLTFRSGKTIAIRASGKL